MESMLSALAFAVLIGAQFLAVIFLISRRHSIYARPDDPVEVSRTVLTPTTKKISEVGLPAKTA